MEEITIGGIKSRIEYGLEHGEDRSSYYKDLGMDVMETSDHLSLEFSKLIMDDLAAEAAANAVATNKDAYVFNPAAVNLNAYGMDSKNYSASMTAFVVKGDPVAKTYPLLFANPIDKLIMLPRQSWTNPIENHNNFREALRQYLENNTIQD